MTDIYTNLFVTIGLSLDIIGVGLLFIFAPPQPDHSGSAGIALEDNTPTKNGKTVKDEREEAARERQKYTCWSKIGLIIIIIGFILQLIGVWI